MMVYVALPWLMSVGLGKKGLSFESFYIILFYPRLFFPVFLTILL